jgi:hypothetical protein
VGVYAIRFEMARKCSETQFIEDTPLVDTEIILDFIVGPISEIFRVVVDLNISADGDSDMGALKSVAGSLKIRLKARL